MIQQEAQIFCRPNLKVNLAVGTVCGKTFLVFLFLDILCPILVCSMNAYYQELVIQLCKGSKQINAVIEVTSLQNIVGSKKNIFVF